MALLAGALIASILIGVAVVIFACTRRGRKTCQRSNSQTELEQASAEGRSDLQGPHRVARSTVQSKAESLAARAAEVRDDESLKFAGKSGAELREVEDRISGHLDEIDRLIEEDEEDLRDMERYLDKSSRRDRRRERRRPKHRRDDPEGYDAA